MYKIRHELTNSYTRLSKVTGHDPPEVALQHSKVPLYGVTLDCVTGHVLSEVALQPQNGCAFVEQNTLNRYAFVDKNTPVTGHVPPEVALQHGMC